MSGCKAVLAVGMTRFATVGDRPVAATEDLRALTPLLWSHVTPYGVFRLDFSDRIDLDPVGSVLLSA